MKTANQVARKLARARDEASDARWRFRLLSMRTDGEPADLVAALYRVSEAEAVVRALAWVLEVEAGLPRAG